MLDTPFRSLGMIIYFLNLAKNFAVTTTNQAITALKMLRENKNKFDLVISDVHMPDMDGFRTWYVCMTYDDASNRSAGRRAESWTRWYTQKSGEGV